MQTLIHVAGPDEVMEVMASGAERRSVAQTSMNQTIDGEHGLTCVTDMNDVSSRSHSVFLMEMTQTVKLWRLQAAKCSVGLC